MPSGSTSALDLNLASPQLLPLFTWHVADDPLGSDHFPVWLTHDSGTELGARPRWWNMRKAEWHDFSSDVEEQIASEFSGAHEPSVHHFTEVLLGAANRHIPRTSGAPRRIPVALRERRRAFRTFDRHSTTENIIAFKRPRQQHDVLFLRQNVNPGRSMLEN